MKTLFLIWLILANPLTLFSTEAEISIGEKNGVPAATVSSPFVYSFDTSTRIIAEAGNIDHSQDPYWWVNSGGELRIEENIGKTIQQTVETTSPWRIAYRESSATDTDEGAHPQNIFRLLTRQKWQNFTQELRVNIQAVEMSHSENLNESNGVLFFLRYQDEDNLYYAGIRVDGYAVIKKKQRGVYTTLAYTPIEQFAFSAYDRETVPTVLPQNTWLTLKSEIKNTAENNVHITLFLRQEDTWKKIAEAVDVFGENNNPITESGYAGIRTDFMDVWFDEYSITVQ